MKLYIFILISFLSIGYDRSNSVIYYYRMSIDEIRKSNEYVEINPKNYKFIISDEILNFHLFSQFFENELNLSNEMNDGFNEVIETNNEILKLNKYKCGKLKIFFSDVKNNVFFSEIFVSYTKKLKYKDKSIFGVSYIYMFKIENNSIKLVTVKKINFN